MDLENLSRKTRERAYILSKNAKSIGIPLESAHYKKGSDYISYYLTNGLDYVIIYCFPEGYLAELNSEDDRQFNTEYSVVKNIRHFLFWLHKHEYEDVEALFGDDDPDSEIDIRSYLDDLDEE